MMATVPTAGSASDKQILRASEHFSDPASEPDHPEKGLSMFDAQPNSNAAT
jgi:hypothetical protein